jgi:hypothetical protein
MLEKKKLLTKEQAMIIVQTVNEYKEYFASPYNASQKGCGWRVYLYKDQKQFAIITGDSFIWEGDKIVTPQERYFDIGFTKWYGLEEDVKELLKKAIERMIK